MRAVVSQQWLVVMPQSANEPMPRPRSQRIEVGLAVERRVDLLGHEQVGLAGELGPERVAGLVGASGETSSSAS